MINKIFNFQFSIFNFKLSGRELLKHPLFSGSFVMIVGSNLANFIAYIYHLIIGRMLGPVNYGILAAVLSLMGLALTTFSFLNLVVVKFVSAADENERTVLFGWFSKKVFWFGGVLFFLTIIFSGALSEFLYIDKLILLISAPMFFFSVFIVFYRSFLQGILKFTNLVFSVNMDMFGRLILGVGAIYLSFSILGVVSGIVISTALAYFLLRQMLKRYISGVTKESFKGGKKIFAYSLPVVVSTLSIFSLFSTDVLLAKHFFSEHSAGIYASLSTIGKIVFFGTAPISSVMFPLIAQRSEGKGSYKKIFILSFLATAGISLGIVLLYSILPNLMVGILFGEKFAETATFLPLMGIFMGIFSLCSLMVSFYLSRGKTGIIYLTPFAAVAQIVGIWFMHESLVDVIKVNIFAASALLVTLLVYFWYENKRGT